MIALYDRSEQPIEIERTAFIGFIEKDQVNNDIFRSTDDRHQIFCIMSWNCNLNVSKHIQSDHLTIATC